MSTEAAPTFAAKEKGLRLPACLIIMDGFGLQPESDGNAIALAHTPVLDGLFERCSWTKLEASGEAVGLPAGQMGNSEVGHLNIGAGRVVRQELTRIDGACEDGTLADNPALRAAFDVAKRPGAVLHLMGLLSDGGVHSSNRHLYALIEAAVAAGVPEVFVHCFLDGRDVPPKSAIGYVEELQAEIARIVHEGSTKVTIASLSGRYYAMDRDNRWDRVQRAYEAISSATPRTEDGPVAALERSYAADVTDEFVEPLSLQDRGVASGDAVVFFNFRPDRARELTYAFTEDGFTGFERTHRPEVAFVCLTEYDPAIDAPIAFPKAFPENVLADVLAEAGLRQYRIAETEKYAHVTFFLNGGIEQPKAGEQRKLIASPKVATYDLQPTMSAPEVTDALVSAIEADAADVYIVNFANCDMVGHTGIIPAAVKAVEAVDAGVGRVLAAIRDRGGIAFVTADHGNADRMLDDDGSPYTAHTTAPVPFIAVGENAAGEPLRVSGATGRLCDIAPTLLQAAGLSVPPEMDGACLLA